MNQEQPNEVNIHAEPLAPSVEFVTHAGNRQGGRTADHSAWLKDMQDRKNRAAELEAKRNQIVKPREPKVELSAIDEVLNAVDPAAEDFEQSYGKPNQPLIDAKIETDRLRRELAEAEDRLATIEARGDSVQRLKHALNAAEAQIESLRSTAESEEIMRLAADHYGWSIPWDKISSEMKRDFRNHASVIAFKKFVVHASQGVNDPAELQQRLQIVGERLVALREHLVTCAKTPGFNP
jgi:predicted RNase H-like nuclease (RuvC/YqgF family)